MGNRLSAQGCTTTAMDVSAMHGHLDVVKWLHANRSEGCTTDAMDWAAKEGRMVGAQVVCWLNRKGWCQKTCRGVGPVALRS